MSKVDFYAELTDNIEKYKEDLQSIWERILKEIPLNKIQKEFKKEFESKILQEILKSHKLNNITKNKNYTYYQTFKILKMLDCNIKYLVEFAKLLEKRIKNKTYAPKIPENKAKELYKNLFLQKNNILYDEN